MGWANCGEDSKGRPIGYAVAATCDHPGCEAKIDRGLAYACGGMHGEEDGCEGYFCEKHRSSTIITNHPSPAKKREYLFVCTACETAWREENPEAAAVLDNE